MDHFPAIARQRRALADVLDTLDADQWTHRSMCDGWTNRHVLAHLTMPFQVSMPRMVLGIMRHRGNFNAYSRRWADAAAAAPTGELIGILRDNAEHRFTPPRLDSIAPLTDITLHGYDIKLPLGLPADYPDEDIAAILDRSFDKTAASFVPAGRYEGLRLVADDLGWSHGEGDEVLGPGIALASALWGRRLAAEQLSGPGAATLTARLD